MSENIKIQMAQPEDVGSLFSTMKELRPKLDIKDFETRLAEQMNEGYQLIYLEQEGEAYALAGFRTLNMFFSGKTIYIDDLVTSKNNQKNGYGKRLIEWIINYAKSNNCDHISLDSGFTRKEAHRFYLNMGLEVESLHFGRKISEL